MKKFTPRRSRIARLPAPIRQQVNELLDQNTPYKEVVAWLAANGHPGYSEDTIGRWKNGGYKDWFYSTDRLLQRELQRQGLEGAPTLDEPGDSKTEANTMQWYRALHVAAASALPMLSHTNAHEFIECVKSFTHLSRCHLHGEILAHKILQEVKDADTKGGLK